jgi:hypothetical protein
MILKNAACTTKWVQTLNAWAPAVHSRAAELGALSRCLAVAVAEAVELALADSALEVSTNCFSSLLVVDVEVAEEEGLGASAVVDREGQAREPTCEFN